MDVWNELIDSIRLTWHMAGLRDRKRIRRLARELRQTMNARQPTGHVPTHDEENLLASIHGETSRCNRNNLTRTDAYLRYFQRNPEVHWALLAHLVSRNGGWNMTDLRGEWFSRIGSEKEAMAFFGFLERANWLIFGDAYPQLLLYEESKKRYQNLSHLLPHSHVSGFMTPIWNEFWETRDSHLLTRALIVNEQNYIESRVVQNPDYSQAVLDSLKYQVQSLLNLNQVVFPFGKGSSVRLAGTVARRFMSLNDRIETGKRLYRILYQDKLQTQAMLRWATSVVHTGSRADYWPEWFSIGKPVTMSGAYKPRFLSQASSKRRIYSPRLTDVWPDVSHAPPVVGEWFHNAACVIHLVDEVPRQPSDFTDTYVQGAQTVENILMAKDTVTSIVR
jgi:hypothetical protein